MTLRERFLTFSLERKLILIIMAISTLALVAGTSLLLALQIRQIHRSNLDVVTTIADMAGNTCIAPLSFKDNRTATELLASLRYHPQIEQAVVFDASGNVFAGYESPSVTATQPSQNNMSLLRASHQISRPILFGNEQLGSITVRYGLGELYRRILEYSAILAAVLTAVTALSLIIAQQLQRLVSGPILQLAEAAQQVALTGDYSIRANKISDDETGRLVDTFNEYTRTKQLESELIRAKQAADEASRAKSNFLATMSHEIRTPMSSVLGMLDLLEESPLDQEQLEFVGHARVSGKNLLRIINDILDISKIEAHSLTLEHEPFDLQQLVDGTTALMSLKAKEKGLLLECRIGPEVPRRLRGDMGRMRQILTNLLANAVKFTHQGSITLEITREQEDETTVTLRGTVQDTGIGISPALLEHIFEPFTQADASTTRFYGGTGLGLAICKQLTALMHGSITAESSEGRGSTFRFTVVLDKQQATSETDRPEEAVAAAPNRPLESTTKRLLLVEDEPANQLVISTILTRRGYQVDIAENGYAALERLAQSDYDLVLLDCMMPILNGYDTCRIIRDPASYVRNHNLPIIALTANAMREDRERCLQAGMDDYLSKPLEIPLLLQTLEKWLAKTLQQEDGQ